MRKKRTWVLPFLAGGLVLLCSGSIFAAEIARSGPLKVSLLEVYSSEGCSSCPPADKWLGNLATSSRLWKEFVPVVFHVDYWDKLGWIDKFARRDFSQRQYDYSDLWGGRSTVYTPGFVLDGLEWRGRWSTENFPSPPKKEAGVLTVEDLGEHLFHISFSKKNNYVPTYKLHAVLLGFEVKSFINKGENAGGHLEHHFLVLDDQIVPLKAVGGLDEYVANVMLESSVPSKRRAVAVWVEEGGEPTPIQAAGGYLP